jgi:hypothetical protein
MLASELSVDGLADLTALPGPKPVTVSDGAIHDYIELFHNTRRRHSALGMLTPIEYENIYITNNQAA